MVSTAAWSRREPWPLPRSAGSTVTSEQLGVDDRVAVGVARRGGDREADDAVALERDQDPVAGVARPAQRGLPGGRGGRRRRRAARRPGSRSAYTSRQVRTCSSAIAGASSDQAMRTETSAVGLLMRRILSAPDASVTGRRSSGCGGVTNSGSVPRHARHRLRRPARRRRSGRAARRDAGRLPPDPDPPDRPARALRDHRHAAGGQLDQPGAEPAPQGDPDGQGAGRGRARALPVRRGRDARRRPRRPARPAAHRPAEVLLDLQLPDADLGRRRRDRLAGRRRRDRQPGAAVPLLLRPVRAGDGAGLQGGVLPPAAGLRDPAHALPRHARRSTRWRRTPWTATGGRR